MSAFTSQFPLEVIETIIDFVATEDDQSFSTIKSCSLVSRRLVPRARTYIFSSIVVNDPDNLGGSTPRRFSRLISQTPEIANYVVSLNYTVEMGDSLTVEFATALSSLTSLRKLSLEPYGMLWGDMPFREAILILMHLPTLIHLTLRHVGGFCISDLSLCSSLKSLETYGFGFIKKGKAIDTYQDPPRLKSYVAGPNHFQPGGLVAQLRSARRTDGKPVIDISGLETVSIAVSIEELEDMQALFKLCTKLTSVHLSRAEKVLVSGSLVHVLPSLQVLQHIHLELDDYENALSSLVSTLVSITGLNIIESIKISIMIGLEPHDNEWGALNDIFTHSKSGWKKLKLFSLHIGVEGLQDEAFNHHIDSLVQKLQKVPETQFKGLSNNKNITFDFKVFVKTLY